MDENMETKLCGEISYNEQENCVTVTVDFMGDDLEHKFSYRIRCNGRVKLECTPWTSEKSVSIQVDEAGKYYAEVWVDINSYPKLNTNYLFCMPRKTKQCYNLFRKHYSLMKLPESELYRNVEPFRDIAVIKTAVGDFSDSFFSSFNHYQYDDENLHVITSCRKYTIDGIDFCFGGITRTDDKLIVGEQELYDAKTVPEEIDGQIGEFCLFYKCKNGYKLISDYFGVSRIYFHQSENMFIACNSYHMLLKIMSALRLPMTLNESKIKASLCEASTIFETSFSFETDIMEINALPIDKSILFSNGSVTIENAQLYNDIRNDLDFDEDEYEKLIYQGVEEVTDNLKITLEHNAFDFVRMDLTGGMDSRLLYGAATRLPRSMTKKLRIRTEPKSEKDFEIANAMNSIYKFRYDDLPSEITAEGITPDNKLFQSPLSANMGGYYTGWIPRVTQKLKKTIHLTGGEGEIVGRPFMKYWFPDVQTVEELFNKYNERMGDIVIYPDGYECFYKQLKPVMDYMPGHDTTEKFDNHNLYFRNGHHFGLSYYTDINCPAWTPLQSKSCFKAKLMSWSRSVDMKPQFDFLALMNPLLYQFPYASDKQNKEKSEMQDTLQIPSVQVNYSAGGVQMYSIMLCRIKTTVLYICPTKNRCMK